MVYMKISQHVKGSVSQAKSQNVEVTCTEICRKLLDLKLYFDDPSIVTDNDNTHCPGRTKHLLEKNLNTNTAPVGPDTWICFAPPGQCYNLVLFSKCLIPPGPANVMLSGVEAYIQRNKYQQTPFASLKGDCLYKPSRSCL